MNKGFTARNWKVRLAHMPSEESFMIDEENNIFAVADGVTRDPSEILPNVSTFLGKIQFSYHYPRPSPAKKAADLFTSFIRQVLLEYDAQNRDEDAIREAFGTANKEISRYRKRNFSSIDYLVNDFPSCVGAVASVHDAVVSYGYIADAGVAVFDCFGSLIDRTENDGPEKYHEKIWQDRQLKGLTWEMPEARKLIRSRYRNNPDETNSFGVLTGESTALYYVRTGTWQLDTDGVAPHRNLLLYTDGIEPIIFSEDFTSLLKSVKLSVIEKVCQKKVRSEGTLIYASI